MEAGAAAWAGSVRTEKGKQIAQDAILQSRISGERVIAITRLILIGPLFLFSLFVFFRKAAETSLATAFSEPVYLIEFISMIGVCLFSVWILRQMKRKVYRDYIKYVSPFVDITLLTLIVFANAAFPRVALIQTGGPTFIYFVFLVVSTLRNSPTSVIFTGAYIMICYALLSINSLSVLGAFNDATKVFTNPLGKIVSIDWDDELMKELAFAITTCLLAWVARRFNTMILQQTRMAEERATLRETLIGNVKEVSGNLFTSRKTLADTYTEFSARIAQMLEASQRIEAETTKEYRVVDSTTATITELSASINQVANSIGRQAHLIAETVAAIEEMGGSIRTITDTSQKASGIARGLLDAANDGGQAVADVNTAAAETEKQSKKIEEIVNVISEIAEQTNLLSMNASIEAAHAGRAGAGFAVIAGEIRKLAENSAVNARQVGKILKDIVVGIQNIGALAKNANQKLTSILGDAKETTNINSMIQNAMEEELRTVNEMMGSLRSLNGITDEVKNAATEQSTGGVGLMQSVTDLKGQADSVSSLITNQMKDYTTIAELSKALSAVVSANEKIIAQLEGLVKSM